MRVFLYEYASAQSPDMPLPECVRVEGRAMLTALNDDFLRVPGVDVLTLECQSPDGERHALQEQARRADWSLLIAPEFDELLLRRCRWVLEAGGRLLGPSPQIVELTGDKWATFELLRRHGLPTPRSWRSEDPKAAKENVVVKPRYGAGSLGVQRLASNEACELPPGFLVQEFVPGLSVSVAFLIGPSQIMPLLPAEQMLSSDGRFQYLGGRLPLEPPLAERAIRLATSAIQALPKPTGYVGVDLVLGDAADSSRDSVIEINPRMTTSYVGLRRMTPDNLAEKMLRVAAAEHTEGPAWRRTKITFAVDGTTGGV